MIDHREIAFESAVEHSLVGAGGYEKGDAALYDRTRAIHPHLVLDFVQNTQAAKWHAIAAYYGKSAADALLAELTLALDARGTLDVLRHGLDFFGQTFHLAYFAPASGLNPETATLYKANPDRPDLPHYGAGETMCKPLLAAIGNAIFDATGVRIRRIPFRDARVLAVLKAAGR